MGLNPVPVSWMVAAGALATIAAFSGGIYVGRALCQNGYLKAEQKAEAKHDELVRSAQDQDVDLATQGQTQATIIRETIREVPKIIDRPVYRNVCVDADGVQLLRGAVEAANGGPPSGGSPDRAAEVRSASGDGHP